MKRYILSREDLYARLDEVDDTERCMPYGDPPCGGCADCIRAQISHWFYQERDQASRFQDAGFECAPYVIDAYELTHGYSQAFAPHHETWRCRMLGETPVKPITWEDIVAMYKRMTP